MSAVPVSSHSSWSLTQAATSPNPSTVAKFDDRSPAEIIQSIHDQGRIVAEALARLAALVGEDETIVPSAKVALG